MRNFILCFLVATIIFVFAVDIGGAEFYEGIAISIFTFWVTSLMVNINYQFPIIELILSMYSLQFLFSPALTYSSFEQYAVYKMAIPSKEYFEYAIPCFISFSIGLITIQKPISLKPNLKLIDAWLLNNPSLPYVFIIIGFVSSFTVGYFPSPLVFVGFLLASFKFVGLFILLLSSQELKPLILISIFTFLLISSFVGGMFHDLLTWLMMLGIILAYKFKPSFSLKILGVGIYMMFSIFIQSIKGGLREQIWFEQGQSVSYSLVADISKENNSSKGGFFSKENIGPQVSRVNQGWILASTIKNVPENADHTYGFISYKYLESAFLPRLFAPNKFDAGDKNIFNKYSGWYIDEGTTMGLGPFTDTYIEFGKFGGIIFVFFWGLMYSFILSKFIYYSNLYPIVILFSFLAFIFTIRPDCETQTSLGHLFKTIILIAIVFKLNPKIFRLR